MWVKIWEVEIRVLFRRSYSSQSIINLDATLQRYEHDIYHHLSKPAHHYLALHVTIMSIITVPLQHNTPFIMIIIVGNAFSEMLYFQTLKSQKGTIVLLGWDFF